MQEDQKQTLAQSIPQNRQARLSGKKYDGPVNTNATPSTTAIPNPDPIDPSSMVTEQTTPAQTPPTQQTAEVAVETPSTEETLPPVEAERVDNDFKEDFQKEIMRQEIETKEDEIARLRIQSNQQQNQLETLTTQFEGHIDTIKKLQSQLGQVQTAQRKVAPQNIQKPPEKHLYPTIEGMATGPINEPTLPLNDTQTPTVEQSSEQSNQGQAGYITPMNETHLRTLNKLQADVSTKLEAKESQLKDVQSTNTTQKQSLKKLSTEHSAQTAVIKNMKQQVNNMKEEDAHVKQIEHLERQIQSKEKQNFQLQKQMQQLQSELKQEQKLIKDIDQYRQQIADLKKQQLAMQAEIKKEKTTITQLSSELEEKNQATVTKDNQIRKLEGLLDEALKQTESPTQSEKMVVKASYTADTPKAPKLTDSPNSINGIVKSGKGKMLSEAVIIIKDITGHNLRALKSNGLGQFVVTTSLPNGDYRVEVNKSGYKFDVVEVTLDGTILPSVEIIGHETTS